MSDREDFNDLQEYLEGDSRTATEAAKRLDRRSLAEGQISREDYRRQWGEDPEMIMTNEEHRRGVTAVIPSIPPRVGKELHRAIDSVLQQEWPVSAISVAVDTERQGSAVTRNRALAAVATPWAAFLDDDDEWYPDHIRSLLTAAQDSGADMIYPWFNVPVGFDPFPWAEGQPFRPEQLDHQNVIPITCLVRTELIKAVGGFEPKDPTNPESLCDDWGTWIKLRDAGAKIVHLPRRTWAWHWHPGNTSGRPIW